MTDTPMTEAEIRQWIDACNHEPAREALRELLAARAELQSSRATIDGLRSERVKPLEWKQNWASDPLSVWTLADTINRAYEVAHDGPRFYVTTRLWAQGESDEGIANCSSLDEAKAAAQADYTQRILSALTPIPAEASLTTARADGIEVERLREALKPFAAIWQENLRDYPDGSPGGGRPDDKHAWGFNDVDIRWGDFRRAHDLALSPPANEPAKDETEVTR